MKRLRRLRKKLGLALAGLVGGYAVACSAPFNPSEAPPLAPRPDHAQPLPSTSPVPGAPDPTAPHLPMPSLKDAGLTPAVFHRVAVVTPTPPSDAAVPPDAPPPDAGPPLPPPPDAGPNLPPIPDGGIPSDAALPGR